MGQVPHSPCQCLSIETAGSLRRGASPALGSPQSAGLHHLLTLSLLQRPSTAEKQLHCAVWGNGEGRKVGRGRLLRRDGV